MTRFAAREGEQLREAPGFTLSTPAGIDGGGVFPPPHAPHEFMSKRSEVPPVPNVTRSKPPSNRHAKPSDPNIGSTPENCCGARLADPRGPGADATERIVARKAARAFLAELQTHAQQCLEDVQVAGPDASCRFTAVSIVRYIDASLHLLDGSSPALLQSLVPGKGTVS